MVNQNGSIRTIKVAPIYANMPMELQSRIFTPTLPGERKVLYSLERVTNQRLDNPGH